MEPSRVEALQVERQIECVARVLRLSELDEVPRVLSPAESFAEVEQLRRMFPAWTGDPDQPMAKVVVKVSRLSDATGT
jgi:hypothetical protein